MIRQLVHILAGAALLGGLNSASAAPAAPGESAVAGVVLEADGRPASGVLVLLSDARTGIPVTPAGTSIIDKLSETPELAGALTGPAGTFEVPVPPGVYNVMAQKWIDPDLPWKSAPLSSPLWPRFGEKLALYGAARDVDVPSSAARTLRLSPPGAATVVVSLDPESGNDDSLLVASLAPISADPVFQFQGWKGAFLSRTVAMNRMPKGRTTLLNVPEGPLHLAVFANDNRPGFGAAEAAAKRGETVSVNLEVVAGWSDARRTPPDRLKHLADKIAANSWKPSDIKALRTVPLQSLPPGRPGAGADLSRLLDKLGGADKIISLPDDTTAPLLDVLTVFAYRQFAPSSSRRSKETSAPARLRVMSYNIHHGRGTDDRIDLPRVAETIRKADPDLVALQEVDIKTQRSGGVDQLAELARLTGMHARFGKGRDFQDGDYGQAVLSRWPVRSADVHPLPGPTKEDERIAVSARIAAPPPLPEILFVGSHLHHIDDALRLKQAQKLLEILDDQQTSSAAILLGDFNAEPASEVMEFVRSRWQDATPDGDLTFPSGKPVKKIDWILVPRNGAWRVVGGKAVPESLASDHRPVTAELEWRPPAFKQETPGPM